MQDQFEFFDKLPVEIQEEIVNRRPISGVYHSLLTTKQNSVFFKPILDSRKPLHDFLHAVVRGEHEKVKALLEENINLLFSRDQVTDCSGRTFENISGFEYALWALDKHMWITMLNCMPQNEEAKKIFKELIAQCNKVDTTGVTYTLDGKIITEQHFDFENTIIKELQTLVNLIQAQGFNNLDALDKQWREGVGNAQTLFPMHVVYECCSDEPFDPLPQFTSQPESSQQFYNQITEQEEIWFSVDSKLGVDFAIYKALGVWALRRAGSRCPAASICSAMLNAMTKLSEVRINDFTDLKSELEVLMMLDNHTSALDL